MLGKTRPQLMAGEGERVAEDVDQVLRFAEHHHVGEGSERNGIGKGERAPTYDQGMAIVAFLAEEGQPGELEHVEDARELQLVADREREAGELRDRLLRLVRARRAAGLPPGGK